MNIHGIEVKGIDLDQETRCRHYSKKVDRIAIKFCCCTTYYACHLCHKACADHPAKVWRREYFNEKAVLCGHCGTEMVISEYMGSGSICPYCGASFNPECRHHNDLYFDRLPDFLSFFK